MKKLILAMAAIALAGCYKDKGNYDYSPVAKVRITMPDLGNCTLGEPLTLVPTIESTATDFDYCWANTGLTANPTALFGDAVAWDTLSLTKELKWVPNRVGNNVLRLYVREKATGNITQKPVTIAVTGAFARGWMVLSNVDGRSALSFVNPDTELIDNVKTRKFVPHPDIWAQMNPNRPLGTGPLKLGTEYAAANMGGSLIYVFQNDNSQVLSGNTFDIERTYNEMFAAAPEAGFVPKEMASLRAQPCFSLVLSTQGRIYSRQMTSIYQGGFYSFLYSSVPVSLGGADVVADQLPDMSISDVGGQMLVDRTAHRVLYFVKNTNMQGFQKTGLVVPFTYTSALPEFDYRGWAADIEPIFFYAGNPSSSFLTFYRKDGKVKWQIGSGQFATPQPLTSYPLKNFTSGEFPAEVAVDNTTVFHSTNGGGWGANAKDPLTFIATGNKMWWFDRNSRMFQHFFDLPAGDQIVEIMDNPGQTELVVVTKGGRFVVLSLARADLLAGKQIYETQLPAGVVDLEYKFADFMAWQLRSADF